MEHTIHLRTATIDDLALLQHWDEQQHVIDCDPNDDWNWEIELQHFPDWREQLVVELEGRPIGFVQIIDPAKEETHYWGEVAENLRAIDIWIGEKEDLNKGYGTIIMRQTIQRCFKTPEVTGILIDPLESNTQAHRFYERIGFKFLRKQHFNEDDCLVYFFDRKTWE